MVCFVFHGPIKAVARSCPFDHTWTLGLGAMDIAPISEPYLSQVHKARIFPFLDNVNLNVLISDTERYNFYIANLYWLNPSILKVQSVTWSSDGQFAQDPYWILCFQIAGDKAAVMGNAYQHLRKSLVSGLILWICTEKHCDHSACKWRICPWVLALLLLLSHKHYSGFKYRPFWIRL